MAQMERLNQSISVAGEAGIQTAATTPRTCRSLGVGIIASLHFLFFFFLLLTTSKHQIVFLTVPTLLSSACEVCLEASCGGASPLTPLLGALLEVCLRGGGINIGVRQRG